MPPYASYLIFGYILNSDGNIVSNASIEITTSVGSKPYTSDSDGIYMVDLAEIGYVSGETVKVKVTEPYNNEYKNHTFVVSGDYSEENISLSIRTEAVKATDYSPKTILHSVGKKPITDDNPLPIIDKTYSLEGYVLSGGDDDNRIYGYINLKGGWYIQKYYDSDKTYKYAKGHTDFSTNWSNSTSLTYGLFDEVFG